MLGLRGMEKNIITPARRHELDELLNDVCFSCSPKPKDYQQRRRLIHRLKAIAKEAYGNSPDSPVVEEFGSFVMDMFSPGSDLDLSINFSNNGHEFPREKKIKALRKFSKKLIALQRKGIVADVEVILGARVPIVKVTDCETGIECDLSVENRDGVLKSQIIYVISTIDERFRKLCILMKAWAKGHNINTSKDRTLNSLSIISLVAFHLQTRDPPILPPFIELLKDGTNPSSVMKLVPNYLDYAKRNNESLGDLFFSLLAKLEAVETLWSTGLCASSFLGSWISKTDSRINFMNVEDFTDRSQNVARAVGSHGFKSIYDCIHNSLCHLLAFLNGELRILKLKELLRMGTVAASMDTYVAYFDNNSWGGKPETEGWDNWVGQKRIGYGGKGQAGGGGEKQRTHRGGRKRKQQTEGREENQGAEEGWGDWGVDSYGSKRLRYSGTQTDAAAHFASPVGSQLGNRVHYYSHNKLPPLPSPSSAGFEESRGPLLQTVSAHFPHLIYHQAPQVVTRVEDSLYNTQFPPLVQHQAPRVEAHVEDGLYQDHFPSLRRHQAPQVVSRAEDREWEHHSLAHSQLSRRFEGSHDLRVLMPSVSPHDGLVYNRSDVPIPVDSAPFRRQNGRSRTNGDEYSGMGRAYHYDRRFSYVQKVEADSVAVKLMDSPGSIQGEREFHNELTLASALHSPHILTLLGFSSNRRGDKLLLVYELMDNRSLQDALLDRKCPELAEWSRRFAVAVEIARGLQYLHHQCDPPVIHGDIKPSNVLLDSNFRAKIGDFGLARLKSNEDLLEEYIDGDGVKRTEAGEDTGSILGETESVITGFEESPVVTARSPESFCLAASPSSGLDKRSVVGSVESGRDLIGGSKKRGGSGRDWWWKQDNVVGCESGRVKDYVMEWIGSEIRKERPKTEWAASPSSAADGGDDSRSSKTEPKKRKKRLEWWASLDEDRMKKKEKNRKPKEWWKEEFCEELARKKKKKQRRANGGGAAAEMWWQRDEEFESKKKTKKGKRSRGSIDWWLEGLSGELRTGGGGDIPKSGGVSSTPSMRGTVCYIAPEYGGGGQLSEKCDVYSFGVLLLVLVSGRRPLQVTASPMSEFERANLTSWARQLGHNGKLLELLDSSIHSLDEEQALLCITIALQCIQRSPGKRPTMNEIVGMLAGEASPPHLPFEFSPSPPSNFLFKSRRKAR